jgi:hypothetical protein
MRGLAHAQATSSNVLSELGGRMSTGPGSNWPSQAGVGSASPGRLRIGGLAVFFMSSRVISRSSMLPCVLTAAESASSTYMYLPGSALVITTRWTACRACGGVITLLPQLTHDNAQCCVLHHAMALQLKAASCAGLLRALLAKALPTASSVPRQHIALLATSATAPCRTGPRPHVPCTAHQVASAVSWPTQFSLLTLLQGPLRAQQPLL